ncbi:MAG: TonB-dependent receptor, partial [Rudanella sp.]|nr:TonB-dependent receptor [Rudanella sp.]
VVGFDQVSVQYGSAASVVGSDAVGGSLLLRTLPDYGRSGENQTSINASVGYQLSSFGNHQAQVSARYSGITTARGQLAGKTVAYGNQFNNQYPYRERSYYYVEPSASYQRGMMQDFFWRNQRNGQWSLNAWFTDNAVTVAPDDALGRERTRTQGYRILQSFEGDRWTARVGWLRDVLDYAKADFSKPSYSLTDRFLTRLEREFTSGAWQIRVGGEGVHYRTRVDGYGGQLITENRSDLYALFRYQTTRLTVSANVRQAFVTRFNPPITPSLGFDYKFFQHERGGLTARASVGRSYRVPTLNERYWEALGNPNLRPERGLNAEMGLAGRVQSTANVLLTADLTAYRNRIDDWTYWNPDRNYRVENLQQVLARGLEAATTVAYSKDRWRVGGRVSYALTRSSQQRAYDVYARDVVGKQLPYVPVHNGSLSAYAEQRKVRLTVQSVVQSRRFSTFDNSKALPGIVLTNVVAQVPIRVGAVRMQVQGQVNNLFDALVLNVKQNAMPGRNYALSVVIEK